MSYAPVLVVNDEPGIREFLSEALASAGYHVVKAENGHESMKRLRDQPVGLMFLDMRMPGECSGTDVLRGGPGGVAAHAGHRADRARHDRHGRGSDASPASLVHRALGDACLSTLLRRDKV